VISNCGDASCFYTARPNRNGALRRRAGSIITAVIRASTPWTAIPTIRKGSSRSHMIGYRINATRASGQQTTNRRHQSKNAAMETPTASYGREPEEVHSPSCGGQNQEFLFLRGRLKIAKGRRLGWVVRMRRAASVRRHNRRWRYASHFSQRTRDPSASLRAGYGAPSFLVVLRKSKSFFPERDADSFKKAFEVGGHRSAGGFSIY
jgi:hypothetical protein